MSSFEKSWTLVLGLGLLLTGPAVLHSQELVTDRPDQTESSVTVPKGLWQLETGWTFSRNDDDGPRTETHEVPGTLLRVGLAERWELRVGWSGLVREDPEGGPELDGAGDGELGAKVYLRQEGNGIPEIALLFGTSVPIGDSELTTDRFDPSFRWSFAHTLSERWSLGYNVGMEWETVPGDLGERHTLSRTIYTVAAGVGISERVGAFVELFGDLSSSDDGPPANSFDGGITWLLQDNLQLDFAGGIGLSDAADDWFLGVGLSLRLPR